MNNFFDDGFLHKVNAPALEWVDGDYVWYYNDHRHRYYGVTKRIGLNEEYYIFGEKIE